MWKCRSLFKTLFCVRNNFASAIIVLMFFVTFLTTCVVIFVTDSTRTTKCVTKLIVSFFRTYIISVIPVSESGQSRGFPSYVERNHRNCVLFLQ